MPQLSDLVEKRKFVKKEYRPWDLSGTGTVDGKEKTAAEPEATPVGINLSETITLETDSTVPIANSDQEIIISKYEHSAPQNSAIPIKTDNETGNNLGNKQITTEKQTDNVQVTKAKQRDNIRVTTSEHTSNFKDNISGNVEDLAYLIDSIKKLAGIQKSIFLYVINVCSARGALDTSNLLTADLANAANCSIGSAKTSLIRLVEKQLIIRFQGKASRGGHMVLGITKEIQSAAIQAQQALFNPLKMSLTDNIKGNTTSNPSSYSSSIYKNITTTALPDEWKQIDFEPLRKIGFSETQLRQLFESKATAPEIVQESINHFSYGIENSDKVKAYKEPLNVLMGVLRKGLRWHEADYVSPKEFALQQILEETRKKKEKINSMIKELSDFEFPEWKKKLTDEQIQKIVPFNVIKMGTDSVAVISVLRGYYTEKILLPRLKDQGLIGD